MTFLDLPSGWPNRSLRDPALAADVIDLVIPERDRTAYALAILLCHPDGRLRQPLMVGDVPPKTTMGEKARALRSFLRIARDEGSALLLALAHPDDEAHAGQDADWARTAAAMCQARGVELLGVYAAVGTGVSRVSDRGGPLSVAQGA